MHLTKFLHVISGESSAAYNYFVSFPMPCCFFILMQRFAAVALPSINASHGVLDTKTCVMSVCDCTVILIIKEVLESTLLSAFKAVAGLHLLLYIINMIHLSSREMNGMAFSYYECDYLS